MLFVVVVIVAFEFEAMCVVYNEREACVCVSVRAVSDVFPRRLFQWMLSSLNATTNSGFAGTILPSIIWRFRILRSVIIEGCDLARFGISLLSKGARF